MSATWSTVARTSKLANPWWVSPIREQGVHMAEVLLFHHAQGQTAGFLAFADELRRAGHAVHAPDLYDGHTFDSLG